MGRSSFKQSLSVVTLFHISISFVILIISYRSELSRLRAWLYTRITCVTHYCFNESLPANTNVSPRSLPRGTQRQFSVNICSEDGLRSRIFGTFFVKLLACLNQPFKYTFYKSRLRQTILWGAVFFFIIQTSDRIFFALFKTIIQQFFTILRRQIAFIQSVQDDRSTRFLCKTNYRTDLIINEIITQAYQSRCSSWRPSSKAGITWVF